MKITDVEVIRIYAPLAKRYEKHRIRLNQIDHRAVFKVQTDNGLVGYGDSDWPEPLPPRSSFEPLVGRDPFDFINNRFNPGLGGALYDVMGKYLEVPAYKLMGQKLRDAVRVAAWTRPASPAVFREEIRRAVGQGYMVFKMHTSPLYDVFEQTRAAEEVAPDGFKIHYDFNGSRTLAAVLPIISELEKNHPIVGFIEDPLPFRDIDGWRRLREKSRIPIVMHHPSLGGLQEVLHGVADIYMIGHSRAGPSIGDMLSQGTAYGLANVQIIVQLCGGTLMKALALHVAAVLPTATAHTINLDDQYEDDITTERIPVIEGFSPVPEGPGLGYEVDEKALARFAANEPSVPPKYVGILCLPGGHKIYTRGRAKVKELTGAEEGTIRGINFEFWEDDGSPEFQRAYERLQKEESFPG